VASRVFRYSGTSRRIPDGLLNYGLMQVVTPLLVRDPVKTPAAGGKDELPSPVGFRIRILSNDDVRQARSSGAFREILIMHRLYLGQVIDQALLQYRRKHRNPVFRSLAAAQSDLQAIEGEILNAQGQTLKEPQSRGTSTLPQADNPRQLPKQQPNLILREDNGQVRWPPC
jgi:hypothetical protein